VSKGGFKWRLFFSRLYDRSFDADIFGSAAQVAFYFSFALFPLLYFLVSLFGLILESSTEIRIELFSYLRQIMPRTVFELVKRTIEEITDDSSSGKAAIGLIAALWSTSAGVDALRSALNNVYRLKETRNYFWTKIQSIIFTFIVAILAAAVLSTVFYGWRLFQLALGGMGLEVSSPYLLIGIQWISTLLVMLFACEVVYNLLPNFERFRWIWINYGSLVAIALWILSTTMFRVYLGYFNTYNRAYGSLGAVIIMMLWLYLTAFALMIGGAINSILREMGEVSTEKVEL
jgi:membrane protein